MVCIKKVTFPDLYSFDPLYKNIMDVYIYIFLYIPTSSDLASNYVHGHQCMYLDKHVT